MARSLHLKLAYRTRWMTMKPKLLVWLAVAPFALAQNSAPLRLTLHDAVVLALRQNPQVILANLNVAQSGED